MAAPSHHRARPSRIDALAASPEAFAAVDLDLFVVEWNPAAEQLTGFSRDDAIGGPLPHLTPVQLEELAAAMDTYDTWADDVPIIVPRRHADGRTIEVAVTAYTPLLDDDGRLVGYGSYFRAVQPTDPRTHSRNVYSRQLAQSVRPADVTAALDLALQDLLPGDEAFLLVNGPHGWAGVLGAGRHTEVAEAIVVPDPAGLDTVVQTGTSAVVELTVDGVEVSALALQAGRGTPGAVLALTGPDVTSVGPQTADLATAVAAEVWAAVQRVDALSDLEGKVETLEAITGVAEASGMAHGPMMDHIARHAATSLSCERSAIYLWDDDHRELTLEAFHRTDSAWNPSVDLHSAGRRSATEILGSARSLAILDPAECDWLAGPWSVAEGAFSVCGLPLVVGEAQLGILVLAHTTANPRGFTSRCLQVGVALTRQAALAISNSRLLMAQTATNQALKEVNRRRADYVEGITHDLRTPITAILGFARTLDRHSDRMTADDRSEALETIERQALRVARMLDDMMDSARAGAGELRPDQQMAVPLHHVVSEAMLIATPEQRRRLTASCDPAVVAWGDADQLTRVVQNLIANALRYAPGESPVEVVVEETDAMAQMLVIDHGPGMPADVEAFKRFSRGDQRGTGLGLYTVKTMVEAHGGTIELRPTTGGGTTVDVRLPLDRT